MLKEFGLNLDLESDRVLGHRRLFFGLFDLTFKPLDMVVLLMQTIEVVRS